ncbi:MAG TPA: ABC transporter permease [Solirubrobacteraceae bacterium]|jgi:ABC-2 type transport system permease protein|nr:ABC transporter permease [Solirubrobacteraceae bacterium]
MSARRIKAILVKDLREAMRDGRILILLLFPIGLAVLWNATTPDDQERPETTVAIVDPAHAGLGRELRTIATRSAKLTVRSVKGASEARRIVDAEDADFAVIAHRAAPPDAPARADVLVPENATPATQAVVALVDDAVAATSGRPPASDVRLRLLPVATADQKPAELVDQSTILVVTAIIMLLGFVALIVVPMQTAEEIGSGTFGALRLAATGPEILSAKAISGLLYAVGGTALTIVLTGIDAHDPVRLYGGAFGLAVSLVGFGLLLGMLSGNPNQINTYGGFLVLPVILAGSAVLFVDSGIAKMVLDVLPFSQGARLLFDGVSAQEPFHTGIVAWLVLAAWSLAGFAVLRRVAIRRDA